MSNPPPLPSRLPPKVNPKPSPGSNSKYIDVFGTDSGNSPVPHSRRPPVAPRKPHRPPDLNGTASSPPPVVGRTESSSGGVAHEGFGTCLQQCYEAITKKHEDELLALESLRGHIFHRARADKEYADNLTKMNQKASKKVANINHSSAVVQVQNEQSVLSV